MREKGCEGIRRSKTRSLSGSRGMYFPLDSFSTETMKVFGNALLDFIREMLLNPGRRPADLSPSP